MQAISRNGDPYVIIGTTALAYKIYGNSLLRWIAGYSVGDDWKKDSGGNNVQYWGVWKGDLGFEEAWERMFRSKNEEEAWDWLINHLASLP